MTTSEKNVSAEEKDFAEFACDRGKEVDATVQRMAATER